MRALEGYLVVSLEQAVAAPLASARLAQAGARVIKIERKEGDFARGYDSAAKGDSSYFAWTNRGKESLVLDIKQKEDLALLRRIIARADVFIQNLAPGSCERLGIGSEDLLNSHPRLICCDISGYGESAELAQMKAYDMLIQSESGLISISGGENEMGRIGVSLCDIGAGVTAHAAIVEALLRRERCGDGTVLKLSLFDVAAEWMTVPYIHAKYGKEAPRRMGLNHTTIAPYGAYQTNDGALTMIAVHNEREWRVLCESVLKSPETYLRPEFSTNNLRTEHRTAMNEALQSIVGNLSKKHFRSALAENRIAYGAVNEVSDLLSHPALRIDTAVNSLGNQLTLPAVPVRRLRSDDVIPDKIPEAGEHSFSLRQEFTE